MGFDIMFLSSPLSMITMQQFQDICPAIIYSLLTNSTDCWEGYYNKGAPPDHDTATPTGSDPHASHDGHDHNTTEEDKGENYKFKSNQNMYCIFINLLINTCSSKTSLRCID